MRTLARVFSHRPFLIILALLFIFCFIIGLLLKIIVSQEQLFESLNRAAPDYSFELQASIVFSITLVVTILFAVFFSIRKSLHSTDTPSRYPERDHFLNSLQEGIVFQNKEGTILECNKAAEQILGMTADQMQGKSSLDPSWYTIYEDGNNFPGERHPAMQVLATGKGEENVIMGVHKPSGSLTWISINSHPVRFDKDGNVLSVVSSFTDITERKLAQELLLKNEQRLRLALDKIGDNAWEHHFETGATWFSAANNHFLGYTSSELNENKNNDQWIGSTHPADQHLLLTNDAEYKAGLRDSHSMEYRIYHKDGSLRWVLDRAVVVERSETGIPVRIIGTHTDITSEKQQQEWAIREEKNKRREIVEAVIQAQEKEREEISYELHEGIAQSLSSINILLEIEKRENSSSKERIDMIQNHLITVINEIRLISQNINTSTLKLMGLKSTIADLVKTSSSQSSIQFILNTTHFNTAQTIDFPVQVAFLRILQEVIKNIIRHSDATIAHIELHSSKNLIQLFTRDNGKGFHQDENEYGLGLKTVFNRAEQYGGNVEIVSSPGKGCLLQIILPSTAKADVSKFITA